MQSRRGVDCFIISTQLSCLTLANSEEEKSFRVKSGENLLYLKINQYCNERLASPQHIILTRFILQYKNCRMSYTGDFFQDSGNERLDFSADMTAERCVTL